MKKEFAESLAQVDKAQKGQIYDIWKRKHAPKGSKTVGQQDVQPSMSMETSALLVEGGSLRST